MKLSKLVLLDYLENLITRIYTKYFFTITIRHNLEFIMIYNGDSLVIENSIITFLKYSHFQIRY